MSEPKKEDWKLEMKQIVQEEIQKAFQEQKKTATKEIPPSSNAEKPHSHWKAEDFKESCPECKTELDKIGKTYMKKELNARKDSEFECEGCGLGVSTEEKECPNCGSSKARHK